jgi:cytochrome c553
MKPAWISSLLYLAIATAVQAAPGTFDTDVKPLLTTYCVTCHGEAKQKGERRFDKLIGEVASDNALVDLQDMLDQLNLGEMPPKEARQPTREERLRAIAWLTAKVEQIHRERKPASGETVLRRLNAREYRNTVRDLLHLNTSMFDPTVGFPRDQTTEHLDNVGGTLVTSGHLLARYLAASERVIDKVLAPAQKPAVQKWTFRDSFRQQPEIDLVHGKTNGFSHITLYDVPAADKPEGAYGPIWGFKQGVPFDGIYEIRFRAEALNRLHPYDPEFVGTDRDEPLRLGVVAGNLAAGPLHKPQPIEPVLAELDLADEAKWYTVRVWLDAGYTPRFTFPNGLMDARNMWGRLVRRYADEFPRPVRGGIVEHRYNSIKFGKLPQIHIHEVEIEGPFYEAWPTAAQRVVLGDDWESVQATGKLTDEMMRRHLTEFAARAYRRPVQPDEVERLLKLIALRRESGRTPLEAYRDGLCAVLCSPAFLYLEEPGEKNLSAYALASRLSYFLWSSLPDQQLLDLAASGQLQQPEVLTAQVRRMLADLRSAAFVEGFLDSWLTLRDLGSMPPDRAKFDDYYRFGLDSAMRQETRLFTRHLLDENLSIANFLDSDFTFVNKPLARHYGVTPPAGSGFERVTLSDRRRGGLLGQASVLTVTANGIDTSPVVRGVWLLENIFGTPPSPPPPDVEPLDPDIRGATTIRQQLEKHRSTASCYDCHRKIDPPGFALENFDAIGTWRERYGAGKEASAPAIDAAGELPDGQKFTDVVELKKLLSGRVDRFAHCLSEKLLAYSLGRTLTPADRPQVDRIVAESKAKGFGLADLVLLVVQSPPFQQK